MSVTAMEEVTEDFARDNVKKVRSARLRGSYTHTWTSNMSETGSNWRMFSKRLTSSGGGDKMAE